MKTEKCYLVVEGSKIYPRYKVIYHISEIEMESITHKFKLPKQLSLIEPRQNLFKAKAKFGVDKIEIVTKEWWQFWRKI